MVLQCHSLKGQRLNTTPVQWVPRILYVRAAVYEGIGLWKLKCPARKVVDALVACLFLIVAPSLIPWVGPRVSPPPLTPGGV